MLLTDFLPTTRREMELRHWDQADVIIFSADAYVDHPAFGAAVIGRTLEAEGYRVAIIPQPDWHGDWRDFRKLGKPRLFFAIAPGCMDSMVNKYTAARRLRAEDAYSPDGRHDCRPERPTIVYSKILRELYPDTPIVLGGIEASMRRLTHYDYWDDRLRPCLLADAPADIITYGMGERVTRDLARRLDRGETIAQLSDLRQSVTLLRPDDIPGGITPADVVLHSHDECLASKRAQAENFARIEDESNAAHARRIIQPTGERYAVVNPPYPTMATEELDAVHNLPFTRVPHPKYKGKRIPAYEMIRHSVTLHRGCFGGCAFCTISAHQGKHITSRSKESILREVRQITAMDDFRGTISDLGGPSANMYHMAGRESEACEKCRRPSCLFPKPCPNLDCDHRPLLDIYRAVDAVPGVRHSYIGSGVRYDLLLTAMAYPPTRDAATAYARELITHHVSGRLKVAPEHTSPDVLRLMRKPPFKLFHDFKRLFDSTCRRAGLRQQIIPYFISSHPGCQAQDMAELALATKSLDFRLEQVQDFTPTPMTLATEMFYTGLDPHTLKPVFTARTPEEKQAQRQFFFWYKPEEQRAIRQTLRRIGRADIAEQLLGR